MSDVRGATKSWVGVVGRIALVAALYVLGARLGLELASENRNVTLVWPPTGIAVALLLIWGYRVLPGVVIGAFVANLTNAAGIDTAAAITVGNTLAPLAAVAVLRRLRFHDSLDRVSDLMTLILVGAAAMTISATAGTASLHLTGSLGTSAISTVWLQWWLGDTFGVVIYAPFLLLLAGVDRRDPIVRRPLEAVALIVVTGSATFLVFNVDRPLAYLTTVPIVWAALRFERFGTSLVVVVVSVLAITRTDAGFGQFAMEGPVDGLISLQIFNAALSFASMVLAIVMHQRTRAEDALQKSGDRYRRVFEQASDFVFIHDTDGRLTYVNTAATQITGYSRERLLSMFVTELVVPESVHAARRAIARQVAGEVESATYEVEIPAAGGRRMSMEFNSTVMAGVDEGPPTFQVIGRDVTTRRLAEVQLREGSLEDPLTGVANIASLRERLAYAIALAGRDGTRVVLAIADLDAFRRINDSIGRDAGDAILVRLASQLASAFKAPETVARLRGDAFALLVPTLATTRTPEMIAEQVVALTRVPTGIEDTNTTASVGVAIYPDDARDADLLIRHAEIAMEDAKRRGGGRPVVYRPNLDDRASRRTDLSDELHRAVADGDLSVHFQPQVAAATLRTLRAECLLRWRHARLGEVPPTEFVPLAVTNGLMDAITQHVVTEAIERGTSWASAGIDVGVCINLSAAELRPQTAALIGSQLESHHFGAAGLTIEVREQDVRMASSHAALEEMCAMGVRLSVDRFGADASSLADLSHLPIAEMKIDRSIAVNVATDPKSQAVARAIIDLAHSLKATAVAVGVETRESWTALNDLGCDAMQGFMICEPLARNEFESWLRTPAWSGRVR